MVRKVLSWLLVRDWNHADDKGNLKYSPAWLKAVIFPYDQDITATRVDQLIQELISLGVHQEYCADGHKYIHIVNFLKYQRIDRPTPSKIPDPECISPDTQRGLGEDSMNTPAQAKLSKEEVKLSEEQGKQSEEQKQNGDSAAALPPTIHSAYENAFGMFTPISHKEVLEDCKAYSEDWILEAIQEAVNYGAKGWKYVQSILKRWASEGKSSKGKQNELSESPEEYRRRYGHLLKRQTDVKTK